MRAGVEPHHVALSVHPLRDDREMRHVKTSMLERADAVLGVAELAVDRDSGVALLLRREHVIVSGGHEETSSPFDAAGRIAAAGRPSAASVSCLRNAPSSPIVLINGAGNTTVEFLS